MLEKGGMSCSRYFSCFTFMVETISEFEVVSKTTKCCDFTVIFPVFFSKMHRDFADFFTVICLQP